MKRLWNEILTVLALAFLVSFSYPAFVTTVSTSTQRLLDYIQWISWFAFAIDLTYGVIKSDNWKRYLLKHPLDVLAVTLPFLRPLRVLRVISFGALALEKVAIARSMAATVRVVITTVFLTYIAAVSVTTVGYGDKYPVTTPGKFLAVSILLLGISLLAVITATIAATFVQMTQSHNANKRTD